MQDNPGEPVPYGSWQFGLVVMHWPRST